jgi:signal transduction histidine kinase
VKSRQESCANERNVLLGDPGRLRQIVVHLIGNAIKCTDQGEVVMQVTVDWQTQHEVLLHFAVTDSGLGLPPDKQRLIFHAFTQADRSTTRRFGGTGLGLAICSRLVTMMGGRIWVESAAGVGSTFHFPAPQPQELFQEIVALFLPETPALLSVLRQALIRREEQGR